MHKYIKSSYRMLLMISFLVFSLVSVSICYAKQETPQEGLKVIINLYKARNFDALLRKRDSKVNITLCGKV